jgi:hypothetical protein
MHGVFTCGGAFTRTDESGYAAHKLGTEEGFASSLLEEATESKKAAEGTMCKNSD